MQLLDTVKHNECRHQSREINIAEITSQHKQTYSTDHQCLWHFQWIRKNAFPLERVQWNWGQRTLRLTNLLLKFVVLLYVYCMFYHKLSYMFLWQYNWFDLLVYVDKGWLSIICLTLCWNTITYIVCFARICSNFFFYFTLLFYWT